MPNAAPRYKVAYDAAVTFDGTTVIVPELKVLDEPSFANVTSGDPADADAGYSDQEATLDRLTVSGKAYLKADGKPLDKFVAGARKPAAVMFRKASGTPPGYTLPQAHLTKCEVSGSAETVWEINFEMKNSGAFTRVVG
jgi:hypothetical protein